MDRFEQSKEVRAAKQEERRPILEAVANEGIRPFNVEVDAAENESLTLANATVLWAGRDDGAHLPVVRVDLSAVALWWLAGGKESKGGQSFLVGVAVPLG